MSAERFHELITKYKSDNFSVSEKDELFVLLLTGRYNHQLSQFIDSDLASATENDVIHPLKAQQILQQILATEIPDKTPVRNRSIVKKILVYGVAAAVVGLIFFSGYFLLNNNPEEEKKITTALKVKEAGNKKNNTQLPQKIRLEDGSVVTLQPGASLHYATHFATGKREVYLDGEAFFEITKNPQRPFFVYHNKLVTQVLGTSFNVKIDKATNNVEVSVKTGRVQVFERLDSVKGNNRQSNGVILTPNQKVLYVENDDLFVPMLVEAPLPIQKEAVTQPVPPSFIYERTSVSNIIAELEKTYGVEIIPENEGLNNCLFTGDLTDPNLFAKLDVICTVIKATYEVKGTQILLKGKGCN